MPANLSFGTPEWLLPSAALFVVLLLLVAWSYFRGGASWKLRLVAATLKLVAVGALALCLLEPLYSGIRPKPGANLFVIAADNSQSLQLRDSGSGRTRGERVASRLDAEEAWQTRLSQDFDVRRYLFDTQVRPVGDFSGISFDGAGSAVGAAIRTIADRYTQRPVAGLLLLTDGNATDLDETSLPDNLPPIFPVVLGSEQTASDIRVTRLTVSETNFEASPVTILVEAECHGYAQQQIVFQLQNEEGRELERHVLRCDDEQSIVHRFLMRPDRPGISFYRVRVFAQQDERNLDRPERLSEATLLNNSRLVAVDRGGGPYRVLYVSGRPNWEFKFLNRAVAEDDEIRLVGLLRIAKKEPKFQFRDYVGNNTNPLWRDFLDEAAEETEQYDQPVLLRLGLSDATELRDGFPKTAEELFRYHAIILDDLEAAYFTQDQMSLIQEFVSQRGGGFLMLGGKDSFASGEYARTPIGELLPVYANRSAGANPGEFRLSLTREGWLQPWVRLRSNEVDEENRLAAMPEFKTINVTNSIKPGASVLAHVQTRLGDQIPALVVQRFGKGRSAALLVGDLWRWNLQRRDPTESDLEKAWRQTVRWLVAEVPSRVGLEIRRAEDETDMVEVLVSVRDESYTALDNADVTVTIHTPEDQSIELTASPSDAQVGGYTATFTPRKPGAYTVEAVALAPDASEVGRRQGGWAHEPIMREFEALKPNLHLLEKIAEQSEGEVLDLDGLDDFVAGLPNRKIQFTETWTYPLWHQWSVLALAVCCLAGEWGLRRWRGLP